MASDNIPTQATVQKQNAGQIQESLQISDLLTMCAAKWYWFLLAVLLCLGVAAVKLLRTPNVYTTSASVLIKESRASNTSNNIEDLLSGGGVTSMSSKLANEMATFKSPALMSEVVKRLNLDIQYSVQGKFHDIVIYGKNSPCEITFLDDAAENMSFIIEPTSSGYKIHELQYTIGNETFKAKGNISGAFRDTLSTDAGRFTVMPSAKYQGEAWTKPIKVSKRSGYAASMACSKRLSVAAEDLKNRSDVLNLSYKDVSPERAEDILNMLITIYNEWWVSDNNRIAISTSEFINERLLSLEQELGNVDADISDYKSRNLLPDLKTASNIYMTESNEINKQVQELENQMYVASYVRGYLADSQKENDLIPMSTGLADASLSSQIDKYNSTLLQRNTLLANSSDKNPLVVDLDSSLDAMRSSILTSLDNLLQTMQAKKAALQGNIQKANKNIAANPNQEKYLLSVERQQKVKEALYLFLLQKREENELSQAFTAYNTKVITPPTTNRIPTEPQKSKILLVALLLGLFIPVAILYLRATLNTRLRGRKDLEKLTVPFLGEIPQHYTTKRKWYQTEKAWKAKSLVNNDIIVKPGLRNVTNEAFRVLRTNLEFMNSEEGCKVIVDTSFNPGSGKTFITANLASALAIKGKKVLIIDGDLRKASLSEYVGKPKCGLSDYLAGKTDDIESLITGIEGMENLYVIPVGTVPPNPSELLSDERFPQALEKLRGAYDYIFIDCPPIDIVADTQIIDCYADRTIFIVRSGLLERAMIPDIQKIYDEKRLNGMTIILNGTEAQGNGRYGYKYGYKYGSSYGRYGAYNSYGY